MCTPHFAQTPMCNPCAPLPKKISRLRREKTLKKYMYRVLTYRIFLARGGLAAPQAIFFRFDSVTDVILPYEMRAVGDIVVVVVSLPNIKNHALK